MIFHQNVPENVQDRTGQGRTRQDRARQDRAGKGRTRQGRAGHVMAGKARQADVNSH